MLFRSFRDEMDTLPFEGRGATPISLVGATAFQKLIRVVHGSGMVASCSASVSQNFNQSVDLKFFQFSAATAGTSRSKVVSIGTWLVPGPRSLGSVSQA